MANAYLDMSVAPKGKTIRDLGPQKINRSTIVEVQKKNSLQKDQPKSDRNNYMILSTQGKQSSRISVNVKVGKTLADTPKSTKGKSNPKSRGREKNDSDRERRRKSAGSDKEKRRSVAKPDHGESIVLIARSRNRQPDLPSPWDKREKHGCCTAKLCVVLLLVPLMVVGVVAALIYFFVVEPSLQTSTAKQFTGITTTSVAKTLSSDADASTESTSGSSSDDPLTTSVELTTTTEASTTPTIESTTTSTTITTSASESSTSAEASSSSNEPSTSPKESSSTTTEPSTSESSSPTTI